jgi:uncharacterized protein
VVRYRSLCHFGRDRSARDPVRLRRYLRALAASAGGTPTIATLVDAAGIDRRTATAYDGLLEHVFLTERLPAWAASRLSRLVHLPKRYLVDPAFLGPLLGVDARAVLRDNDLLGRLLDNFVVSQLRADSVVSDLGPQLFTSAMPTAAGKSTSSSNWQMAA